MKHRRWLACALALALLAMPGWAEEDGASASDPTPTPTTTESTAVPTATPEATAEPTDGPTAEPTDGPTAEPTDGPTAEPTNEPTTEPTVEPVVTPEPSGEPVIEPTVTPEPTAQPPAALPTPGAIAESAISINLSGAENMNGVWRVALASPNAQLGFSWTASVENAGFVVYVDDTLVSDGIVQTASISLPAASYAGQHTLYVGAIQADGSAMWGGLSFEIAAGGGFPDGSFPGGRGFPGGGRGAGDADEAEQGFHVTPGTALTSSHASGVKTLAAFGSVQVSGGDEAVSAIEQVDSGEKLLLDNGESTFYVSVDGDNLTLRPEGSGECWQFSLLMLEALRRGGVAELCLGFVDGDTIALDTGFEMGGTLWGRLRSAGYVGKDCLLLVSASGMRARINGIDYLVDADGVLSPAQ